MSSGAAGPPGRPDELPWDPDRIDDDVLALMFIACHPVLSPEARVALTLRAVGGLTSEEIARAFLVPVPTVQARITRAKKTIAAAEVPFELLPDEPEVYGLLALFELTAARFPSRTGPDGEAVLLEDQDRRLWDRSAISRGLAALGRVAPSPVVELNRAVAVAMANGPREALALVDDLVASGRLPGSYLLPSVRGELLARLGRTAEARAELELAARLCRNVRERSVLLRKAAALA